MPKIPSDHRFEGVPDQGGRDALPLDGAQGPAPEAGGLHPSRGAFAGWSIRCPHRGGVPARGGTLAAREGCMGDADRMRAVSFDAVEMDLSLWWYRLIVSTDSSQ
ncbi:hypothetical protein [Candidatus Magnetaquiglobus chichijimensis]|uniref:hypothetical protein n=1 Tax=Candidatus Magnetaquiglobus chichijimensis TaxID=3141448 RepID=UPI003B973119